MHENTPKNFVIQLGSLLALYVSLTALITLSFQVINLSFPDPAESHRFADAAQQTIRSMIAMLVVFAPAYLILTRMINKIRRFEESGLYTGLARWLVYLSLLIAGAIILGDLVMIITYFLNGEITARFILKAITLLIVISATFTYYLLDVRSYFKVKQNEQRLFGAAALIIVVVALLIGFTHIDTPQTVRESRIDDQQIADLADMQSRVEQFYRINNALPTSTAAIYPVGNTPTPSEGRQPYGYNVVDDHTYEICATFAQESTEYTRKPTIYPVSEINYSWDHPNGNYCFKRVVTKPTKTDTVAQ